MVKTDHIDPNAVPKPTGNPKADIERLYDYLFMTIADLRHRLEILERNNEAQ